jgi:tetratricopeptide (TPR) repeat protein
MRSLASRLRIAAVALLALGTLSRTAWAADDAGTQSVFGYGVGDRALAMGSAFVATADDASALYWNPAGLGWVDRAVLQLDQVGRLGLGFREGYAAAAVPSWRWGTTALTLRQFTADGVEARDERNVLTGEFGDSELELALGFGRRVGEIWSLGGAVKMQRQTLAGLSASGLGVDLGLGVTPPWLEGARFAFAVRNAVRPALRLVQETVPDPTTVRTGVGYRWALSGATSLLTEVDVEKVADVGAKVHAGMEYSFHEFAMLRGGLNGDVLTMGTGLRWGGVTLDYAFENSPIEATHRVGLSVRLGRTVDESRLAARRAEDEALEKRMAEAFQERQAEQIQQLLGRAAAAQRSGQYDDALDAMGAGLTIAPANAAAKALQGECLRSKATALEQARDFAGAAVTYELALAAAPADTAAAAGAERCRAESDRAAARSEKVRRVFAAAMDALAAEDFLSARDGFAGVLKADPHDAEAAHMLERTRQSLIRRAGARVEAANRDLHAGRLADASAELEQAAKLDPHAPGLDDAAAALRRAKQLTAAAPRTSTPVDASKPAAGTLSDREVEELYRLGLAALNARRMDDALRYWEHVWAERNDYRGVGDFLKREYLARGMEAFAAGRLEDAVAIWEKVLRMYPDDPQARGYVARAQMQILRSRELGAGN